MENLKRLSIALIVLWMATEICSAQIGTPAISGGPASASDQQVQAADLAGKRGQQKVDLFTGSFGYSVPINCAPARNGSEPNLAVAYSSAGDNGWCGMGWNLEIGDIERNTRDGIPIAYSTGATPSPLTQYDDTKGFMLNLSGKGYKLFPVATNSSIIEYRAEVDTDFLRCFCDTNNNNWTVYDKGGNAYYFGEATNSRVSNPKTGWSGYSGTFHWALDQIVTATGDLTTIAYTNYTSPFTGLSERTLYPTQIAYNGRTNSAGLDKIIFQTEVRTNDWHFSFRSGFRTDVDRRLTNILCQVGSQNVWSYNLKYGISPATSRSLLTNVVVYGYDAGNNPSAYLTNTFTFQANANAVSFGATMKWTNMVLNTPGSSSGSYEPYVSQINNFSGFNYTVADLIDMDGDGLPDRVNYDTNSPNRYQMQKNLGMRGNGFGSRYLFGYTSTGSGSVATNSNPFPDGSGYAQLNTPYGRIRDINGDGLPDRVMDYWWAENSALAGSPPPSYVPYTNYMVQLNMGQSFSGVTNWPVSTGPLPTSDVNSSYYYCVESGTWAVGFFDINGDGLPDRVMSGWYLNGPMTNFMVQFNTGTNFTQQKIFGPYHSQNYNTTAQTGQYNWAGIETSEAHMIDINGDGLPDRLMYPMNPSSPGNELPHPTSYYAVEYDNGYSFESTNSSTNISAAYDQWLGVVSPSGSTINYNGGTYNYGDAILAPPFGGLFDVNGDGLPDRVMLDPSTWSSGNTKWLVYLNNGHGFNATPVSVTGIDNQGHYLSTDSPWWSVQGTGITSVESGNLITTLIDIDGDGLLDRVMAVYDSGNQIANSTSNYFLVQLNTSPFPDLLTNINNGIGGSIGITYNPSTAYDNRVDPTNANSVSHMPYPRQVTATVTANDGINPSQTTTYAYGGGFYDGLRREFHGFAVVTNTDPTLRMTVTYFHTGGGRNYSALGEYQDTNSTTGNFAKAGMAYRIETYGNDNALYHVQVNQVDQASLGNGRYFPFTTLSFNCDYPGNGTPKVTATDFVYDTSTENLTNKIDYGQVTGFNPTNTGSFSFSDTNAADTRYYNTHFTTIGSYIVNHPDAVSLTDSGNNVIQEAKYTYNSPSGTIATKLTRISAGYYATNSYDNYTSYGLVGTITDPVGVQTTITYDSTYNTYPATTTIGTLPPTTTSYDARSGELATSTDPAGITISNSFDSFLRPIETDKIPVGGGTAIWMKKFGYPATLKAITSGVATNYTDTAVNDGVGGFTNRTYIDGFGRPVQSRTQGENGNYRVISTAYDGRGIAFLTTWPQFESPIGYTKPANQTASWTGFDAAGRAATNRLVTATFSSGVFSSKTDLTGDTGSGLAAKTWSYVNSGDPWWIICTDEDGKVRRYQLDAFGHTNQIQEADGGNTYTTTLKYDLADNLTNIVNANGENIYYAFDNANGMVAMADPYLGQWTYQRDYSGRVRVQTDGRGDVIKLHYTNASGQQDPLGRVLTKEIYSTNYSTHLLTPVFTNTYVYDSSDDGNYTVYPGLLYMTTDSEGYEKTGYDPRGRPIKTTRHLNIINWDYTTTYTYNDGDKVTSTAYPNSGPTITNSYFHGGSINQVSRGSYNYYTVSAGGYDEFGHTTNFVYGNTLTTTRSYYSVSKRLQSISSGTSGSVFSRTFTYSNSADIASISGTGLTNTMSVTYDNLHRIKTYSGLSGSYAYDAIGTISNSIEGGGSAYGYGVRRPQAVKIAFGSTNLYDLCGNMIVRHASATNSQSLVYDAENQLVRFAQAGTNFTLVKFGYDGGGARLWKWFNQNPTNLQIWIGNIYEEKGGKKLFHVYAGDQLVCTFETNSALYGGTDTNKVGYYYHQDQLTSSSVLSDSSGNQTEVDAYYPFGRTQAASPQASFKVSRQFTGQILDAETGLYYCNRRYYDPELGRFIQANTVIQDLSNPQSYNRYSYCINNPLRYTDPTGLDYLDDVGGMFVGYYDAGTSLVTGTARMIVHPINTVEGIGTAIAHPINTGSAIASGIAKDWNSGAEGQGRVVGGVLLAIGTAFAPGAEAGNLSKVGEVANAGEKASSLLPVKYDPQFAAEQILGGSAKTPGGRTITPHAADRMVNPPAGRSPMSASQVDQVLDEGDRIRKVDMLHPKGPTVTIQNTKMLGKPQVVVDAETGNRVVTVIQPKK